MRVGYAVVLGALFGAGCTAATAGSTTETVPPATSTTIEHPVTTSAPTTTSTLPSHDVGLFRVDPATLTPIPGIEPLATGDWNWVTGEFSSNGKWLVLHSWVGNGTNRQLVQVIETATGEIVTEKSGDIGELVGVSDDGTVYSMINWQHQGSSLRELAPGAAGVKPVFSEFPSEFVARGSYALLDSSRAGWLWTVGGDFEESVAGVVVADLITGEATTHTLDGMMFGEIGQTDLGGGSVYETVEPAVIWDAVGNRVLLVHGDEEKITILDLGTGDTTTHDWSRSTSWSWNLLAWLVPPAQAKGPSSYGVVRNAALSPSGEWLYVGTSVSELVVESEESWFIEHSPRGVVAMSTETWEVVHPWDIAASEVTVSPGGEYVVATGTAWTESLSSSHVQDKEVFVIDAGSHEVAGQFGAFHAWSEVQFSPDGRYLYVGAPSGPGHIEIVDLAAMEVIGTHRRTEHTKLFGGALLVVDMRP